MKTRLELDVAVRQPAEAAAARWILRAHAAARVDPTDLLDLCRSERALLGATHAALSPMDAQRLSSGLCDRDLADTLDCIPCLVHSADRSMPPLRATLSLVPLAPYGIQSFREIPSFLGAIHSDLRPLPDFRRSIGEEFRDGLRRALQTSLCTIDVGARRFDIVHLSDEGERTGLANAVRRSRLGAVFAVRGSLFAAIDRGKRP